jgi:hypothetical protein
VEKNEAAAEAAAEEDARLNAEAEAAAAAAEEDARLNAEAAENNEVEPAAAKGGLSNDDWGDDSDSDDDDCGSSGATATAMASSASGNDDCGSVTLEQENDDNFGKNDQEVAAADGEVRLKVEASVSTALGIVVSFISLTFNFLLSGARF